MDFSFSQGFCTFICSKYRLPQSLKAVIMGISVFPNSESEYSVFNRIKHTHNKIVCFKLLKLTAEHFRRCLRNKPLELAETQCSILYQMPQYYSLIFSADNVHCGLYGAVVGIYFGVIHLYHHTFKKDSIFQKSTFLII